MNKIFIGSAAVIAVTLTAVGIHHVSAAPPAPPAPIAVASAVPSASAPAPVKAAVIVIQKNTQATVDDVRLAAFNFRDESGMSCALQVFVRGDDSKDQKLRVHGGETFTASNKQFEVLEVGASSVSVSVK